MVKDEILDSLKKALTLIKAPSTEVELQLPTVASYGDYTTNVAMKLAKDLKKNPVEIADMIVKQFPKTSLIKKITVVKPGFINFEVDDNYFYMNSLKLLDKVEYLPHHLGSEKKIMVEFAHPNTHKLFHIGHLRNISTGESIVRILEASGNKIVRSNYQGDVGLHIAKCLYGIKKEAAKMKGLKNLQEKIEFIGKMYSKGTKAYEDDPTAKVEILTINKMIYDQSPEIMPLWTETRQWSLDYYNEVYKRVYSHFDRLYFESELPKRGMEIVSEALKKGILEKSQGAIVFNGKKCGLDTRVFVNSLGFPTYEGKEPALAEKEFADFGLLDKCIHVVTPEQTSFFKVTFKVEELLDEKKYKNKQYHLIYEWVKLKEGKMSSREGNIIEGNWLIDETKKKILKNFKCDEATAEILAIASVKYSFLKNSTQTIIHFDIDESIATDGNSAPYLIYTYVRSQSILRKEPMPDMTSSKNNCVFNDDENKLLRTLYQYQEIVKKAAVELSPNVIANYLYELASQFNLFYQKNPILKAEGDIKKQRLLITALTAKIIKEGLYLLGIKTVEKM